MRLKPATAPGSATRTASPAPARAQAARRPAGDSAAAEHIGDQRAAGEEARRRARAPARVGQRHRHAAGAVEASPRPAAALVAAAEHGGGNVWRARRPVEKLVAVVREEQRHARAGLQQEAQQAHPLGCSVWLPQPRARQVSQ